jgi:hypothetical protein
MAALLPPYVLHLLLVLLLYAAEAGSASCGELLQQFGDAVARLAVMLWQRGCGSASSSVTAHFDTAVLTNELQAGTPGNAELFSSRAGLLHCVHASHYDYSPCFMKQLLNCFCWHRQWC